jgi:PilZ domain
MSPTFAQWWKPITPRFAYFHSRFAGFLSKSKQSTLIIGHLNKFVSMRETCNEIATQSSTKTGVPMSARENLVEERTGVPPLNEERRRFQRIHLQVPLFIRGKDAHGEQFVELAKTLDISALGAFITSPRALSINGFVTLTIPAPSITSSGLVPAGMAPIQAKVKRQQEAGDVHLVGVEFLKPIG